MSQARPGLSGLPRGWWYSKAVSIHRGWQIFSAFRSDSREWPIRIGVAGGDGVTVTDGVVVSIENGFRLGSGGAAGAVRRPIMSVWTCSKVVVTLERASAVIPDHLQQPALEKMGTVEIKKTYFVR